jgi:hypothetical protein
MARQDKARARSPRKDSWLRSLFVKMGLALPRAEVDAHKGVYEEPDVVATPAESPSESANAPAAVEPPVPAPVPATVPVETPATLPQPAAEHPAGPVHAAPEAPVTRAAADGPGMVPVGVAAAEAAEPTGAEPVASAAPAAGTATGHEVVEGFDDDAQARQAAAEAHAREAAGAAAVVGVAGSGKSSRDEKRRAKAIARHRKVQAKEAAKEAKRRPATPSAAESRPGTPGEPPPARPRRRRRDSIVAAVKDPKRRSRLIIWLGALVLFGFGFVAIALGVTSSYWFCANACHKVQDDTIIAYNRSAHNKLSCMACHMPVNADPVTFMIHKVKALGELYTTVTNQYELPLNPESEVAKEMPDGQCLQCHTTNRTVTATKGIKIDHKAHAAKGIGCTSCHNRVAHVEDFKLVLAENRKHEDWMKMEACYRCHSLTEGVKGKGGYYASGECSVCHPKDFPLKPGNHKIIDFERTHVKVIEQKGKAYCLMCHGEKRFCNGCHGTEIPHPAGFKKNHGAEFKAEEARNPGHVKLCLQCHGSQTLGGQEFCNGCHHKGIDVSKPFLPQHMALAKKNGAASCVNCHNPVFCAKCHTSSGVKP